MKTVEHLNFHRDKSGGNTMWVVEAQDEQGSPVATTQGQSPEVAMVMIRELAAVLGFEIPDDLTHPPTA